MLTKRTKLHLETALADRDAADEVESQLGGSNSGSNSGSGSGSSTIIYADSAAEDGGDGSFGAPFKSLQDAIDAAKAVGQEKRKVIEVAPNSAFDEDVKVTADHLAILSRGAWTLGAADQTYFGSSTARNFTWEQDSTNEPIDGRPTLILGSYIDGEASSTHIAYASGLVISGDLILTNPTVATTHELQLYGVDVKGDFDTTADSGILNVYIRGVQFDGASNAPNMNLILAESVEFDDTLICSTYGRMLYCELGNGMTSSSGPGSFLPPSGFFGCDLSGAFDTGDVHLDAVSNYFFNNNSATLSGGASRVLLHDETV